MPITSKEKKTGGVYTKSFIIFLIFTDILARVCNHPYRIYIQDLTGLRQLNTIITEVLFLFHHNQQNIFVKIMARFHMKIDINSELNIYIFSYLFYNCCSNLKHLPK
jgi:hypothetical protein